MVARADALRDKRDFAAAAEIYGLAVRQEPANAAIRIQCAHMNKEAGHLAAAEADYLIARTLTPDDPDLHLQIGHFFKVAGRVSDAISSYQMAERLSPGWQEPIGELAALGVGPRAASGGMTAAPPVTIPASISRGGVPPRPSQLFDESFYVDSNPDVEWGDADAWTHFVTTGCAEGRDPHFLFSVRHYLAANPDVAKSGENPLLHFLRAGWAQGRSFHWMFSAREYARLHPDIQRLSDPLAHFLQHGLPESRQPHPLFRPTDYLRRYPDLTDMRMPAFEHFLRHGDGEGRSPHILFDPERHRTQFSLRSTAKGFEHYMRFGRRGSPHPLFDGGFYLDQHPEIDASGVNPLQHYVATGAAERLAPHPLFDPAFYLEQTSEPEARSNPLLHYVASGAARQLSPHRLFDARYYQARSGHLSWTGDPLPTTGPRISVLVPVYNTPPPVLEECIESVRRQSYSSWELCIIDDASTNYDTVRALERYRGVDARIKIVRASTNQHIAKATNLVAEQATGEFIAFLDHDDTIEPEALAEIALAVTSRPDTDLLYTDEDKIDAGGNRCEPYYKPDWSPDHLLSVMYVLHFLVIRKSLFWRIGGLRPERSGAQDYDLALRAGRVARHVHHIPRILYHWRMIPGSAAAEVDAKPYALQAARAAVEDAVAASGLEAAVEDGLLQGTFRVRYSLAANPPVTLLVFTNDSERDVPGRGRINMVRHFLRSIVDRSSYGNYRIVVVDNGNASAETRRLVSEVGGTMLSYAPEATFNYARKANFATRHVSTEHVVYLNDDLEVISEGWLEALLELSQVPEIGGVGGRLLYPNDRLQHSGVVLGVHGGVGHAFWQLSRGEVGYSAYTHLIRNYSAVSGAVFATRMQVMDAVGGFDERLKIDYNDIDLCLRMAKRGWRTAFTPHCELYHFEGSTQARTIQAHEETALFHERWRTVIDLDPYYNPNLPRDRLSFA